MEMPIDVLRRFMSKVHREGECWVWHGARDGHGYGCFRQGQKTRKAYRVAFEHFTGAVGEGLHLDHLCRNRKCVNPTHLEPVTQRVNNLRGVGPAAVNAKKTHCPQGHEYSQENTYIVPSSGGRTCRSCDQSKRDRAPRKGTPSVPQILAARTHCKHGHEFSPENTKIKTHPRHARICLTCVRDYNAKKRVK